MPSDADVIGAVVRESILGGMSAAHQREIARTARLVTVPAGRILAGGDRHRIGLIAGGLLRVFISAPNGREVTLTHAKRPDLIGSVLLAMVPAYEASAQTLIPSRIIAVDADVVRAVMMTDASAALLIVEQLARELRLAVAEIEFASFATLRQRVARQILAFAQPSEGGLRARVTQQQLADAVGSLRESVARTLGELREERIVASSGGYLTVTDPSKLARIASLQ